MYMYVSVAILAQGVLDLRISHTLGSACAVVGCVGGRVQSGLKLLSKLLVITPSPKVGPLPHPEDHR